MAAVSGVVRVRPLFGAQVAAVDGGMRVFPHRRQRCYVEQERRGVHFIYHLLNHLHLIRVYPRVGCAACRHGLPVAALCYCPTIPGTRAAIEIRKMVWWLTENKPKARKKTTKAEKANRKTSRGLNIDYCASLLCRARVFKVFVTCGSICISPIHFTRKITCLSTHTSDSISCFFEVFSRAKLILKIFTGATNFSLCTVLYHRYC